MNVRQKLVELLGRCAVEESITIEPVAESRLVDFLVNHGVTVQEWISVKDRLPGEPMRCLVYTKRGKYWGYEITYYNQGFYTQYAEVIYWMPLPGPPKGE